MATASEDPKLPPSIAYPFIATNIVLLITILINLSHQFQEGMITAFGLIIAVCDIGLAIAVFAWLRHNAKRAKNSS